MRIFLLLISFVSVVAASHVEAAERTADLPYAALNRALTETIVLPAYTNLVPAMATLAQASTEFCLDPPTGVYTRLIDAFHAALAAWQRAQPINFGPVAKNGRAERFEFWPDTGASTDRQIRRAMSEHDPAMVTPGGLDGKSIALQNLATFERLLAENAAHMGGGAPSDEDRYACAWMTEIARFQLALAKGVADDWTGSFATTVLGAEAGDAYYVDARAAATDYLKSLAFMIDIVVRQKLERPMDSNVAKARASRAESWRTKRSLDNIIVNLEVTRDMFTTPGGFADLLTAAGSAPLARQIRNQFDAALASAHAVGMPLEDALGEAAARPKLDELLRNVKALRVSVTGPLATDTNLVIGFNSLDGD
jgi:hypothetical protein